MSNHWTDKLIARVEQLAPEAEYAREVKPGRGSNEEDELAFLAPKLAAMLKLAMEFLDTCTYQSCGCGFVSKKVQEAIEAEAGK